MRPPSRVLTVLVVPFIFAACAERAAPPDRYHELYERLHPSVAFITMEIPSDDVKRKGKWDRAYGSGVVIASGTWGSRILTDAHVIADARGIRAQIGDAGDAFPVRVVAKSDAEDDLAILEIDAEDLPAVTLGTMDDVFPGKAVGVLGYPIPDAFEDEHLRNTVSLYAGRVASIRNGTIEIDVPIIPGESGGPVFDAQTGAVVGLAESRFDDERAIGFATPVDIIERFVDAHPRRKNSSTG